MALKDWHLVMTGKSDLLLTEQLKFNFSVRSNTRHYLMLNNVCLDAIHNGLIFK